MKKLSAVASTAVLSTIIAGSSLIATPRAAHAGARAADSSQPFVSIAVLNSGAPMNLFNTNTGLAWGGLNTMPLGFFKNGTDQNAFYPALATRWSASDNGRTVTVYLRPTARWSTGQQITAQDVYTTMELDFATGAAQAFSLGSMTIVNDKEIVFKEAPSSSFNQFLHGVLLQTIAPASVFGHLLPKNILATINAAQYTGTNAALMAKQKAAQTALTALGKTVSAYAPAQDVAAGPFKISAVNPGEAVLVKNPYFYGARTIKINQVTLRNYSGNQQIWNYIIGGQVYQATSGGMSTDLVNQMKRTPGNIFYSVPSYATTQMVFNESVAPYNMLQVRQAIAYAMNRQDVQRVGEPTGGSASKWSTGMIDAAARQWLTPAQLANVNTYSQNLGKAAQLLQSAGFKKSNGHWMLPNGKPWDLTIYVPNGFNDWVEGSQILATELSSFGINAHPRLVSSYAQYLSELGAGKIPVGFWVGSLGPNPYSTFDRLFGVPDGYSLVGGKLTYTRPSQTGGSGGASSQTGGGNWLGFPQTVNVSGYGQVNVGEVTNELNATTDQATIKRDMQKLAATSNQYLPAITLWNFLQAGFVNDKYFTNFPLHDQTALLAGQGFYPPVGVWMVLGYVQPR